MDRTDNYEVLTHLRNLNQILNNDPRCKDCFSIKQRKIVFIYVVNSSIFKISNETVKFFDASINVSPVVSSTNSWQFLINFRNILYFYYVKGKDPNSFKHEFFSKHLLDDQFLIAISRYLKDLRVVKEIFNDYQNVIEKIGWFFLQISDQNLRKKLVVQCFSFALFRCILTKEYDNLNINKGTTYNLLNRKYECQNLEPFEIENKSFYELFFNDSIDLNLIPELKNQDLLKFLLINNFISENYRLFSNAISSKTFCNRPNDMHFLISLIKESATYNPTLNISDFLVESILHYFPNTNFLCNGALNYVFLRYLTCLYVIQKQQKYQLLLDKYVEFIFDSIRSSKNKETKALKSSSNDNNVHNFIIEMCDHFEKLKVGNIKLEKGTVNQCKKEWLKIVFSNLCDSGIIYQNYRTVFGDYLGNFCFMF